MIDGVIGDVRSDAKEEIPGERIGDGIAAGERSSEPLLNTIAVPFEVFRGNCQWFGSRNALRPEAERTIRPNVNFAHFTDCARLNVFDSLTRLVGRMALIAHLRGDFGLFGLLSKSAR